MMRKYGVEDINEHFMSFNTICDATQVGGFTPLVSIVVDMLVKSGYKLAAYIIYLYDIIRSQFC